MLWKEKREKRIRMEKEGRSKGERAGGRLEQEKRKRKGERKGGGEAEGKNSVEKGSGEENYEQSPNL